MSKVMSGNPHLQGDLRRGLTKDKRPRVKAAAGTDNS